MANNNFVPIFSLHHGKVFHEIIAAVPKITLNLWKWLVAEMLRLRKLFVWLIIKKI